MQRLKRLYTSMVLGFLLPMAIVFLLPLVFYQQPIRNRIGDLIFDLTVTDILKAVACVVAAMTFWILASVWLRRSLLRPVTICGKTTHLARFLAYSILGMPAAFLNALLMAPQGVENWIRVASLLSAAGLSYGIAFHREIVGGRPRLVRWGLNGFIALDFIAFVMLPLLLGYLTNVMAMLPVALILLAYFSNDRAALRRGIVLLLVTLVLAVGFQSVKGHYREWFFGGEFRRLAIAVEQPAETAGHRTCDDPRQLWLDIPRDTKGLMVARERIKQEMERKFQRSFSGNDSAVINALQKRGNADAAMVAWWLATVRGTFHDKNADGWLARVEATGSVLPMIVRAGSSPAAGLVIEINGERRWNANTFQADILTDLLESGHIWADFSFANRLLQARYKERWKLGLSESQSEDNAHLSKRALGTGNALLGLALLYEDGHFFGRDMSRSARLYALALEGEPLAGRGLGQLFLSGTVFGRDKHSATTCFAVAARAGDEVAAWRFADLISELPLGDVGRQQMIELPKGMVALEKQNIYRRKSDLQRYNAFLKQEAAAFRKFDPNLDRLRYPFAWVDEVAGKQMVARVANRLSQLGNLAVVIRETPERFAYLGTATYEPLATWFIPRVIWPDKPREVSGLLIGQQLGLSHPGDEPFAWSMPVLVEAWLAGGVVYYMFSVLVVAIGILIILTLSFRNGEVGVMSVGVVGLVVMAQTSASGLSATVGGAMQAVIFVFLLNWGISRINTIRNPEK